MTVQRYEKIMRVLAHRQPDLTILAENVYKPHNLSAMLRSCDAVGIGEVHAVHPTGGVPTFNETSASADKWLTLTTHPTTLSAIDNLRAQGMTFYAAHLSQTAIDYREVDYTLPTCIVLGNERDGVSDAAAQRVDQHIIIPMLGMVQSLNVSVAAAVILFEAQRQRVAAGMYDAPRLDVKERERQAFMWLYTREADMLLAQGKPFPSLDETGNIKWPEQSPEDTPTNS